MAIISKSVFESVNDLGANNSRYKGLPYKEILQEISRLVFGARMRCTAQDCEHAFAKFSIPHGRKFS